VSARVNRTEQGYQVRFIRTDQANELMNLYHLARVPLSGTGKDTPYDRMIWASKEFSKEHPEVSATAAYKDLDGLRSNWFGRNPAVSAEQYGLAQAVLSGSVRGPSMPVSVAREIIDHTPEAEIVKFSQQLAAKRNPEHRNPGQIGVEPGKIGVYYINFGYFAEQAFDNMEQALELARRSGFEASFWRDGEYLGTWSILRGFERPLYGPSLIPNCANPSGEELYREWIAADEAFSGALQRQYGRRAGDIRYDRSKQTPEIQALGDRFRLLGKEVRASGYMDRIRGSMIPNAEGRGTSNPTIYFDTEDAARKMKRLLESEGQYVKVERSWGGEQPWAVISSDRVGRKNTKRYGLLHLKKARKRKGNPVVATLTQGTIQAEVLELGHHDYQVIVSGKQGQLDEMRTDNLRTAMDWARIRIFETSENPDVTDAVAPLAAAALGPAGTLVWADQGLRGKSSITSKAISKGAQALKKLGGLFPRANPEGGSADLYEEFHGVPSGETIEYIERQHYHEWLSAIGPLIELEVENEQGTRSMTLKAPDPMDSPAEDVVMVAFNERRGDGPIKGADQAFFVGGDQSIDLDMLLNKFGMVEGDIREKMVIGRIRKLTYRTKKTFEQDGKSEIDFYHEHGKEGARGVLPFLVYKPLNPSMEIVGGRYSIAPGTTTLGGVSPGIVG
jgi:hypothetical protein